MLFSKLFSLQSSSEHEPVRLITTREVTRVTPAPSAEISNGKSYTFHIRIEPQTINLLQLLKRYFVTMIIFYTLFQNHNPPSHPHLVANC